MSACRLFWFYWVCCGFEISAPPTPAPKQCQMNFICAAKYTEKNVDKKISSQRFVQLHHMIFLRRWSLSSCHGIVDIKIYIFLGILRTSFLCWLKCWVNSWLGNYYLFWSLFNDNKKNLKVKTQTAWLWSKTTVASRYPSLSLSPVLSCHLSTVYSLIKAYNAPKYFK